KNREETLEKELNDALQASVKDTRPSNQAEAAIAYCNFCIETYEDWYRWESRWIFYQCVVVVGGVVATLAGVITFPRAWLFWLTNDPHAFSWLRGIPAAVVTIAAGFLSSFTYREDAVRHELTAQALRNELVKFQSHAKPYNTSDEAKDTSEFLNG